MKYIIPSIILCLALITGVYINHNDTGNIIADMSVKCEYNDRVNHRTRPDQKIADQSALNACEVAIKKVQLTGYQVYAINGLYWAEPVK